MGLLIRNLLLRLFVKICVLKGVVFMVFMAIRMALSSACRIVWYPSLYDICVLLLRLQIPKLDMFPSISPSKFVGGMSDTPVYMHLERVLLMLWCGGGLLGVLISMHLRF